MYYFYINDYKRKANKVTDNVSYFPQQDDKKKPTFEKKIFKFLIIFSFY